MDIVVISSAFVKNEQQKKRVTRVSAGRPHFTEKRRNRVDRRKSVRDGVVVSLSCRKERRTGIDRRRADTD